MSTVNWQTITVPPKGLVFTWCQVPVVYELVDNVDPSLTVTLKSGEKQSFAALTLSSDMSAELFQRSGRVRQITVEVPENVSFAE